MPYFEPADLKEHARGNSGADVPDYCRNCWRPFMEHTNGVCPTLNDEGHLESPQK